MLKLVSEKLMIATLVGMFFILIGSNSYADESEDGSSTISIEDSAPTLPSEEITGSDDEESSLGE